jgi:hypothetical protein
MNLNYNIIPCFVEKNPKQHLKFVLYQNKVCGFLLQVHTTLPTLLQIGCLIFFSFSFLFSKTLTFWTIPSRSIMIKTTRIQNSNSQSSFISPYPNYLVHPKSHTHPTPLTLPCSFRPQNPCKMTEMKWEDFVSF